MGFHSLRMRSNRTVIVGVLLVLMLLVGIVLLQMRASAPKSPLPSDDAVQSSALHPPPSLGNVFRVAQVIDGDTIDVFTDGDQSVRVRLIGIDTPETVDERKPVQCYGPEASARMKELLTGTSVILEVKPDEDKDEYGRLLRYIVLDGRDIGAQMLEEGYARSLCYAFPHPRCGEYDALERQARNAKRGRWGACR